MKEKQLVICAGFPKCGTTSVARILDMLPSCHLHPDKEPGALLDPDLKKEDYVRTFLALEDDRVIIDFTTSYGFTLNRERVISKVCDFGLENSTKVVICVREPLSQAASNFEHKLRALETGEGAVLSPSPGQYRVLIEEVLAEQAYRESIDYFCNVVGEGNVYLVRIEDVSTLEAQYKIALDFCRWLDVPLLNQLGHMVKMNRSNHIYRYGFTMRSVRNVLRKLGFGHFLSIEIREKLRSVLGQKIVVQYDKKYVEDVINRSVSDESRKFYSTLETGLVRVE